MKTTIYYCVMNGGDGSASPDFFDSMALAELIEENEDEGFSEATGSLVIESDGPITSPDISTIDDVIKEASEDLGESWWNDENQEWLDKLIKFKEDN